MTTEGKTNWQTLEKLAETHDWITVSRSGDQDDQSAMTWRITFAGKGLTSGGPEPDAYSLGDHHDVELTFAAGELSSPVGEPSSPVGVRVLTPLFHPNVAPDGLATLPDVGISWQADMSIDVVIERIWDAIRCAYIDAEIAINGAASRWFATQTALEFPLDSRTLSVRRSLANIVRYRHKRRRVKVDSREARSQIMRIEAGRTDARESTGIHFID